MPRFRLSLYATARVCADDVFEAESLEAAIAKVKADGLGAFTFTLEDGCVDGNYVEGDGIADLIDEDAPDDVEPTRVDLREAGEPFSWAACNLAKEVAATPDIPDDDLLLKDQPRLLAEIAAWREFQSRARGICQDGE